MGYTRNSPRGDPRANAFYKGVSPPKVTIDTAPCKRGVAWGYDLKLI